MVQDPRKSDPVTTRRGFLSRALVATGLGAVMLALGGIATRYIYPLKGIRRTRRIFLAPVTDIPEGKGRPYTLPDGGTALVTNTGREVVALSNICPHLGCKVHYEAARGEFLCPCHGGVFEKNGTAIAGPPADEKTNLKRYAVSKVGNNLFIDFEEIIRL